MAVGTHTCRLIPSQRYPSSQMWDGETHQRQSTFMEVHTTSHVQRLSRHRQYRGAQTYPELEATSKGRQEPPCAAVLRRVLFSLRKGAWLSQGM